MAFEEQQPFDPASFEHIPVLLNECLTGLEMCIRDRGGVLQAPRVHVVQCAGDGQGKLAAVHLSLIHI